MNLKAIFVAIFASTFVCGSAQAQTTCKAYKVSCENGAQCCSKICGGSPGGAKTCWRIKKGGRQLRGNDIADGDNEDE